MKQIIWTSEMFHDEKARKEHEDFRREYFDDEENQPAELSDEDWYRVVNGFLDDERMNLNKPVDGVIIAFANMGLWNGRHQGYKILGSTINDIFSVYEDGNEWYGDGFNIRGCLSHHDGTHYVLYRVAKDREDAERIADLIYNRQIDEADFRKRTRSLYPYVANIYGWKAGRFNKTKAAV